MSKLKAPSLKGVALKRPTKPTVIIPFVPGLPDVNLLPPRVFDAAQAKKVQGKLLVVAGVIGAVIVAGYTAQSASILLANRSLDSETAKSVTATAQVNALKPVKVFYAGVTAQKAVIQKTMAHELYYSKVVSELLKNSGSGVSIKTVTLASSGSATSGATGAAASGAGTSCPAANPFAVSPMVSCIQMTGTANERGSVSVFLTNLINSDKFANAYIPVTDSSGTTQVTFNGSVGITEKFFSNRYANDAYLLNGVGAAK